jgi:hypothetical protein
MNHGDRKILESRDLSREERDLVRWLLLNGYVSASDFIDQLDDTRVYARCACGCASIDFTVRDRRPARFGLQVLSDYEWRSRAGLFYRVIVFEQDGLLSGLELWPLGRGPAPKELPTIEALAKQNRRAQVSSVKESITMFDGSGV